MTTTRPHCAVVVTLFDTATYILVDNVVCDADHEEITEPLAIQAEGRDVFFFRPIVGADSVYPCDVPGEAHHRVASTGSSNENQSPLDIPALSGVVFCVQREFAAEFLAKNGIVCWI